MISLNKDCDSALTCPAENQLPDVTHMSWSKVKFPGWKTPSSSAGCSTESGNTVADYEGFCYPWKLRFIEGRGYCAFSNRKFIKGDLILTESPTIWVHGHHPFTGKQLKEVDEKIEKLSISDKNAFFDMANVFTERSPSEGIFMTNSFDMAGTEFSDEGLACGMYVALARLNHSCVPNVQQTHVPATGDEVLYASRDIEIGEEVCDCYIDLRQSREERRKELLENFRFVCACSACSDDVRVSTEDSAYKEGSIMNQNKSDLFEKYSFDAVDDNNNNSNSDNNNDNNNNNNNNNNNYNNNNYDNSNNNKVIEKTLKSIEDDDVSRLYAATFEDKSIDYITQGSNQRALRVLVQGIAVLTKEENLIWSVRYVSSAHLGAYQILNQMNSDKLINCNNDNNNNDNNSYNNNKNKKGKRDRSNNNIIANAKIKTNTTSIVSTEYSKRAENNIENSIITQMRYHLSEAHSGNIILQGPFSPDSLNTQKLMRKHSFI